jgi:hypothetical protein
MSVCCETPEEPFRLSLERHVNYEALLLHLKQIAARLTGQWPPTPPRWPDAPPDPDVGVREPTLRNPGGRSSAVAVREPDPDQVV